MFLTLIICNWKILCLSVSLIIPLVNYNILLNLFMFFYYYFGQYLTLCK